MPKESFEYFGVIGCYYFKNPNEFLKNSKLIYVSEIINSSIKAKKSVNYYFPQNVSFFGDPKRLRNENSKRGIYISSVFVDIDGTLIAHQDKPNYRIKPVVLEGTVKKINHWIEEGHYIILCTARKSADRNKLEILLNKNKIKYNQLITGLPSGPRILINDRKPYNVLKPQSYNIDIDRNEGIDNINLFDDQIKTIKEFKGGSSSSIYLAEDFEKKFVRKIISKKKSLKNGPIKLKDQFNYLSFLSKINNKLVPYIYQEAEDSKNYYYDIEYLDNFSVLNKTNTSDRIQFIKLLFKNLNQYLYNNKSINDKNWLNKHIDEKIIPKISSFNNKIIDQIVQEDNIVINSKPTISISSIFDNLDIRKKIVKAFLIFMEI